MSMSMPVRPWRPLSQLDLERIRGSAAEAFEAWLARWIAQLPAGTTEAAYIAASRQPSRTDALAWRMGDALHLITSEGAIHKAALLALDLAGTTSAIEVAAVGAVTAALRESMLDDLVSSIAATYAQSPVERLAGRLQDDPEQALVLELRRPGTGIELLLQVDRAWAASFPLDAPPPVRAPALAARAEALEESRVAVTAILGRCRLSVLELAQLAVGDVVTCDTRVDAAVELSLLSPNGHSGATVAKARPGRAAGHWAFLLSDIESQKVANER